MKNGDVTWVNYVIDDEADMDTQIVNFYGI